MIATRKFVTMGGQLAETGVLDYEPAPTTPPLDDEGRCASCGATGLCLESPCAHWPDCEWVAEFEGIED